MGGKAMAKRRLDVLMVERGLAESQEKAKALIMAGEVVVEGWSGVGGLKPGSLLGEGATIRLLERPPFVSRGGLKLAHALDQFHLDVSGLVAADIGASSGGFTDCLLQRGMARVYAIDVGYGQLDYRLRQDPRVVVMERVNARYSLPLPEKVSLATIDVSFISVEKVIPSVLGVLGDGGFIIVLIKPQFEAGRVEVARGGLVKDPQTHARVLGRFLCWAIDHGFRLGGLTPSPILGAAGNREFLVLLRKP